MTEPRFLIAVVVVLAVAFGLSCRKPATPRHRRPPN